MLGELYNKLLKLNTVPDINRGGCGIVAHAFYTACTQNNIPAKIVYIVRPSIDDDVINKMNNNEPTSCAHVMVKIGRYYYDTEGVYKSKIAIQKEFFSKIELVPVDPEYAYAAASAQNSWNKRFNRERYANIIPRMLGVEVKYHKDALCI